MDTNINFELIHPYENIEFERYLYIASQRYLICRIEEGIRYGYYGLGHLDKTKEGLHLYAFSLENDEKYRARRLGVLRREYQVRNHTMFNHKNQEDLLVAYEKLHILANELIDIQEKQFVLFNFSKFHPDKNLFQEAERIAKLKERIVESLTKDYYLDCDVKGVKIYDLLCAYRYLDALSEVLYFASMQIIDDKKPATYIKEVCLVDISYLVTELSRIHDFEANYAQKLIDRFVFHEKKNRDDDIFAQPLIKISKTQIVLSQAERVSIELPDQPFDQEHIILVACTDAYDYTPLKYENIFITDDSSYLKYFTNPYVDAIEIKPGDATIHNLKSIWKKGYPDAKEFMEYLMNPVTIHPFSEYMKKQFIPVPVMDEEDCAIFCEDYILTEDSIRSAVLKGKKNASQTVNRTLKKRYPNDPCPCGSGKKYKKCCKNKSKM